MRDKPFGSPTLIYLVEHGKGSGLFTSPSHTGFTAGQTAWMIPSLHFQCHYDAKEFADQDPMRNVVKLRIYARQEPIRPAKDIE